MVLSEHIVALQEEEEEEEVLKDFLRWKMFLLHFLLAFTWSCLERCVRFSLLRGVDMHLMSPLHTDIQSQAVATWFKPRLRSFESDRQTFHSASFRVLSLSA